MRVADQCQRFVLLPRPDEYGTCSLERIAGVVGVIVRGALFAQMPFDAIQQRGIDVDDDDLRRFGQVLGQLDDGDEDQRALLRGWA